MEEVNCHLCNVMTYSRNGICEKCNDKLKTKCKDHPKYAADKRPKLECPTCMDIWLAKNVDISVGFQ